MMAVPDSSLQVQGEDIKDGVGVVRLQPHSVVVLLTYIVSSARSTHRKSEDTITIECGYMCSLRYEMNTLEALLYSWSEH